MYNIAVKYLIDKYKDQCLRKHTPSFQERLAKSVNRKETRYILDNITESDWVYILPKNLVTDDVTDQAIFLLLGQYYYGIAAKKDLEVILSQLNLEDTI
jgi:hypothetical protein